MQVIIVKNTADFNQFLNFARELYKDDETWICPLDKDISDVFNPKKNKNYNEGESCLFLLLSDTGKVIGRIAAFYTIRKTEPEGGIGFFECIQDQQAANKLFDTARDWLKGKGCRYMDGPVNFGERDKYWGLLVSGFTEPSYQENYNPPYYRELFENYGFCKVFEQTTSELSMEDFKSNRFFKLAERVFQNKAYRFEPYRQKHLEKYAADFIHIYNKAWASRPDFTPITLDRIESTLHSLKPIMIEEAICFAYAHNEPAGFFINVLDVNKIFKQLNGRLDLWGKLKFLYYRRFMKIDRVRGIVFGVIPEYQNLGLESGMIISMYKLMREKHPHVQRTELSWIGDFNPKMHSLFEALGAKTSKIHYTYRKDF